jgi:hypothetical protein
MAIGAGGTCEGGGDQLARQLGAVMRENLPLIADLLVHKGEAALQLGAVRKKLESVDAGIGNHRGGTIRIHSLLANSILINRSCKQRGDEMMIRAVAPRWTECHVWRRSWRHLVQTTSAQLEYEDKRVVMTQQRQDSKTFAPTKSGIETPAAS